MNEKELNTIMSVVTDPIANVYRIDTRKDLDKVRTIIQEKIDTGELTVF